MKIRLDSKFNAFPNKTILGYVGETNARTITFSGLSVSGANSYSMIIDYGDGENYEVNIVDGVYTVDASVLKRPGLVNCQVLAKALSEDGATYTIVKKSNIFVLNIGKSIDPGAIPTYEQATSAVEKLIQINPNANDVLNFTQQIDQNVDDIAELSGSLDYQNENVSNGEGKVFEYIAGSSHVTDYDRSLCTISAEVPNAMYGNGFTADDDLLLTKIHIDANTIRVLVNTIDSPYDWTVYSDVSVTDGVANVSIPVKKGQSVFVGWQDGTVQYSPNISGFECFAYTNYKFSNSKITVKYLVSFNLEYSYYDKTEWYDVSSILTRKSLNWLAVGDSITYGDTNDGVSYADYIADKIKINLLKEGHSGYPLRTLLENFASFDADNKADIITIFAGTNDFNLSLGAGTENDIYSSDVKTIWATCNTLFPYLLNRYPTKPIIFFTPIQRKYSGSASGIIKGMVDRNGITLREYAQSIIDAGKKYGIPVVDLYSVSGIGVNNISEMTNDGLHPNEIGQKRIANIVLSEIMKYTQII